MTFSSKHEKTNLSLATYLLRILLHILEHSSLDLFNVVPCLTYLFISEVSEHACPRVFLDPVTGINYNLNLPSIPIPQIIAKMLKFSSSSQPNSGFLSS